MKWGDLIPWQSKQTQPASAAPPAHPLDRMRWEMERLFDAFHSDFWGAGGRMTPSALQDWGGWSPSIDVSETETETVVRAEVPGVDPKDLELSVSGDVLTISGSKEEKHETRDSGIHHSECSYGSFKRVVPLPDGSDAEGVTAEHSHGVLTVRIRKQPGATPKRIPVKST